MSTIREISKRIKSISNTRKVTHAMELVAAVKMRKSQLAALSTRPYSLALDQIISEVRSKTEHKTSLLTENTSPNQIVILVSSDRGLAGGLNINLFREVLRQEFKNIQFITVGKKAQNFVVKTNSQLLASYQSEEKGALELARILTKMATDAFTTNQVSKVSTLYPHFDSTIKQIPKWIGLLPIKFEVQNSPTDLQSYRPTDLIFEPSAEDILKDILPHHVLTQIYQVLLESKASEHSARMVAMKNATDAASDLIDDLTLTFNQVRQEAITKELLDVVTAQKAFE